MVKYKSKLSAAAVFLVMCFTIGPIIMQFAYSNMYL